MHLKKSLFLFLLSLSVIIGSAQQKSKEYLKEWKRIDSLVEKSGLVKTALQQVNAIYTSAKKENNDLQVIKSLVYRMSINDQLSEQGKYENITLLEKEIISSKEPARSVLHSLAGGSYWHYLQLNRWQFYNRTALAGNNENDIATWDITKLYKTITDHFDASIKNDELLKKTNISQLNPIIVKGNVTALRPTLYDLLAHRALDYFRNDETYITKPAYAFSIHDSIAFAEAPAFVKHRFVTKDSLSLHIRALQLFQDLIAFHLADQKPQALIDADIHRLHFVHNFGVHPDKSQLYRKGLERIIAKYKNSPGLNDAKYLLADWHMSKGRSYDPLSDTINRFSIVEARMLVEDVLKTKDQSEGRSNALMLLREINRKEMSIKAEKINTIGEPFRMLVSYRNFTTAHFRLVKMDRNTKDLLGRESWDESFWNKALKLAPLRTFTYNLPDTKDHQLHRLEIKIDALPAGEYALIGSPDKNFALKGNVISLQRFYVSDIAYVNNGARYHVLNRKTGKPLSSARVQAWREQYNYQKKKSDLIKLSSYNTDKTGYFELKEKPSPTHEGNILLDITNGNDRLFTDQQEFYYAYTDEYIPNELPEQTFLFADRSIYRPGQTLYFKGIMVLKKSKRADASVITSRKTIVRLIDANGEVVDSTNVTTSEFGSYSGKFTLPTNLLNGQFTIHDNSTKSELRVVVEEYKRPKFFVDVAKPTGTFRLNDTISLLGTATSYAGNSINEAIVNYRVTRRAIIPLWTRGYSSRIWPPHRAEEMEIINGTTETDANGKFMIRFPALPDLSISKDEHPVFHYEVITNTTDINGETRTAVSSVEVAYEAMKLDLNIENSIHSDSLHQLKVAALNMNDSLIEADVKVTVHRLNHPAKIYRERYWEQPDQFIMSKEEYHSNFPHDIYSDETDMTKWVKGNSVTEMNVKTSPNDSAFSMQRVAWEPGWYLFEATSKDQFNQVVSIKEYVQVYNSKLVSPFVSSNITAVKKTAEPGDKINYSFLSNVDSSYVIIDEVKKDSHEKKFYNKRTEPIQGATTIGEKDHGLVTITSVFVTNNRIYSDQLSIAVPYFNKQLKIDYTTFRDKTVPGTKETWKVKISGHKKDKVAAELLTGMYDASLDQFYPQSWTVPNIWDDSQQPGNWDGKSNFNTLSSEQHMSYEPYEEGYVKIYDRLITPQEGFVQTTMLESRRRLSGPVKGVVTNAVGARRPAPPASTDMKSEGQAFEVQLEELSEQSAGKQQADGRQNSGAPLIQPRTNLNETAFFFPALSTDSEGNVEISFNTPDALTTWKWMLLAHTKDLAFGYGEKKMITQKQLMVQPNVPRFLREGDELELSTKIANMSTSAINGEVMLQLTDPSTGKIADLLFNNKSSKQKFSVRPGQSVPATFRIKVPLSYNKPLTWKLLAVTEKGGTELSDGEQAILPVISNRMLVTETITLPVRGSGSKSFNFHKLSKSSISKTLKHHSVTVEFTSNPAWYAVQSLPYLTEQTGENAEQVFNRYYANALAATISTNSPRIKDIISKWNTSDTAAFLSNLQKNEELKSVLLQETPWVLEAKTEAQQKKNIALLFDMIKMAAELKSTVARLREMQTPNGGFVWLKGGREDRYMTQYILTGIGHLKKLGTIPSASKNDLQEIASAALKYIDQEIKKDYAQIRKSTSKISSGTISALPVQYLYMRSFFTDMNVPGDVFSAYNYFRNQAKKTWVKQNTYLRGMIALSLQRTGDPQNARKIIAALKESAITNEELGMYWKDVTGGYYWHQASVETQSLMIEAFSEITKDTVSIADLKTWLLKNKQTNSWRTSKATADACYALLLQGSDWLQDEPKVTIKLGDKPLSSNSKKEAGTGYFKTTVAGDSVKPSMGAITVSVDGNQSMKPAWGAVYWQYFEDLNKITGASTPLKIRKKLFVQKNTDRGPVLVALGDNNTLKVGDKVKVRIEIRSDRLLEYVHMKDMRASSFEPVNVLSGYKWEGGLGYYESTKDASTNFYFESIRPGVYVFEYDLFATHAGKFSNGITTIQCMYAPEFTSHSEGIQVNVLQK